MPKNYYIILGIPEDSTPADVKSAYRRLAKEYHPDHFGRNHNRFQVIHEAYTVLSDPARRRLYDKSLQGSIQINRRRYAEPVSGAGQTIEPLIPEERRGELPVTSLNRTFHSYTSGFDGLFDQLLANFVEADSAADIRLKNVTVEIVLTPEQARRGGNVRLNVPVRMRCPSCQSQGQGTFHDCWRCSGSGYLTGEKPVLINYPAGIVENHTIQLALEPQDVQQGYLTAIFTIRERR